MENKKAITWLKVAFMIGVITDALAVIPMVFTGAAKVAWGFNQFPEMYKFAMYIAAAFMFCWTILLYWAYKKPLERSFLAPLTAVLLVFFITIETVGIRSHVMALDKTLPMIIMQATWTILFGFVYIYSRKSGNQTRKG